MEQNIRGTKRKEGKKCAVYAIEIDNWTEINDSVYAIFTDGKREMNMQRA